MGILSSAPDQSLSKEGATFPSLPSEGKEGDWKGVGEVAGVTSLRGGGGAVRSLMGCRLWGHKESDKTE